MSAPAPSEVADYGSLGQGWYSCTISDREGLDRNGWAWLAGAGPVRRELGVWKFAKID